MRENMTDIGNPLYFCVWLQEYLESGGNDLEMIESMVKIPIKCQRGMMNKTEKRDEYYDGDYQ
jgi:hypothetical protein